jgi:DNA-damage-inducible protein J
MADNAVIRARIDERIKNEASQVLAAVGLTMSDAIRLLMVRIAADKALPFNPFIPNQDTIDAMRESRAKRIHKTKNLSSLIEDLNADN